jgi:chitodextrinase
MIKRVQINKNIEKISEVDVDMKKWIIALSICTLLTCSAQTITAAPTEPTVRLPSTIITLTPDHDSTQVWFNFTLTGVPSGYDVTDDVYPGWCVDKYNVMDINTNHRVTLKSCYADDLSNNFKDIDWEKINYIINHRQGKLKHTVQYAMWYFTDGIIPTDYPGAWPIINDTKNNSAGYIPGNGDILAIAIEGESKIQLAFLELAIPIPNQFEGLVWYDTNADGLQGANAKGIPDVTVQLYYSNDTLFQTTTTNTQGHYIFNNVLSGQYYLKFILKSGYKFTIKDAGSDDSDDSDADTATGKTIAFNFTEGESITIWDAGMYVQSSGGTPENPEVPPSNELPSASASSGEPYQGFVNATMFFNGSRSYDIDGRIISWRWTFGDGTNGTGETTTHKYTLPGIYNVSLLVMDNDFGTNIYPTIATITTENNPPGTPVIAGPHSGVATINYQYTFVSIDPDNNNLIYFINWGDGPQIVSSAIGSGEPLELSHQWAAPGFYIIQAQANDTYTISDIAEITVAIDVIHVQNLGYLIDMTGDGVYEKFHSNETGVETTVNHQADGTYLIDTNGDGKWNTLYNPVSGQTQVYREQPILQYALIILAILIAVFLLLFYIMRGRRRSRTISKNQDNEEKKF